jgi:hypothetical protein
VIHGYIKPLTSTSLLRHYTWLFSQNKISFVFFFPLFIMAYSHFPINNYSNFELVSLIWYTYPQSTVHHHQIPVYGDTWWYNTLYRCRVHPTSIYGTPSSKDENELNGLCYFAYIWWLLYLGLFADLTNRTPNINTANISQAKIYRNLITTSIYISNFLKLWQIMYLDITIPWCKFKKKMNDEKMLG